MTNPTPAPQPKRSVLLLTIWSVVTLGIVLAQWDAYFYTPAFKTTSPDEKTPAQPPFYHETFVTQTPPDSVHNATGYMDSAGKLHAFWWAGSREGAKNVEIYTSTYQPDSRTWSAQTSIVNRHQVSQDLGLYIKKLGNEVVFLDSQNRLWLFFVTVSAGGWATSHINVTYSDDNGQSWSQTKRLYASRFLNLSHLVKCKPFEYADGSIGLPAYHEMAGKFAVILQVNRNAEVINQYRITHGRYAIQPTLMIDDAHTATALMRSVKKDGVLLSRSSDAGQYWSDIEVSDVLQNPNAGISGLVTSQGNWLLAYNDHNEDRANLDLAYSSDQGQTWTKLHILDVLDLNNLPDLPHKEFSYPWLMQDTQGDYHVFYTWHRHRIKHVTFNQAWLNAQLSKAEAKQ